MKLTPTHTEQLVIILNDLYLSIVTEPDVLKFKKTVHILFVIHSFVDATWPVYCLAILAVDL